MYYHSTNKMDGWMDEVNMLIHATVYNNITRTT